MGLPWNLEARSIVLRVMSSLLVITAYRSRLHGLPCVGTAGGLPLCMHPAEELRRLLIRDWATRRENHRGARHIYGRDL